MKHRTQAALAVITLILAAACAGTAARANVLLPAMRAAWPSIKQQAEQQALPAQVPIVEAMDAAIQIGTEAALAGADWPTVRSLAFARIQARAAAGEIGAGVAASLNERVTQFGRGIEAFTSRTEQ